MKIKKEVANNKAPDDKTILKQAVPKITKKKLHT